MKKLLIILLLFIPSISLAVPIYEGKQPTVSLEAVRGEPAPSMESWVKEELNIPDIPLGLTGTWEKANWWLKYNDYGIEMRDDKMTYSVLADRDKIYLNCERNFVLWELKL